VWLPSLKVAQLLRSAACLHTNQSLSYLNHLVIQKIYSDFIIIRHNLSAYIFPKTRELFGQFPKYFSLV